MNTKQSGLLISSARKEKELTQKELAQLLHISDRTVSKWERGAGFPDVSLLIPLADALDLSVTELLQGTRQPAPETEISVRHAIGVLYRHGKAAARKNRMRMLAAALAVLLVLSAAGGMLYHAGKDRILFPPALATEALVSRQFVPVSLFVDRQLSGRYTFSRRYTLTQSGTAPDGQSYWKSYTDSVPADTYTSLKSLCPQQLLDIRTTPTGFLALYYGELITIIETDAQKQEVFRYDFDPADYTAPCQTVLATEELLHILSYQGETALLFLTTVNKLTGAEHTTHFSCADLTGDANGLSMGGFLFRDGAVWIEDDVLSFAQTHYGNGTSAVIGAYDLKAQAPIHCTILQDAQVVHARKDGESVSVLVNAKHYTPLTLYMFDAFTWQETGSIQLELPHEFLAAKDSAPGEYLLFGADMTRDYAALLLGEPESSLRPQDSPSSHILALYDCRSGQMIYRARLALDAKYDIYQIKLG